MSTVHNKDRKNGPPIYDIGDLSTPQWEETILDNGIKLVEVNMGTQDLVSLEIIHFASRSQENKKGAARAVARLLREGTSETISKDIAEKIDYYGASMSTGANLDFSFIKLFTLTKYFEKLLPVIKELRYDPIFPEEELDRYIDNNLQKLVLDESKVELTSYKAITETLFGKEHVYGYNSDKALYESLNREDLTSHFNDNYGSSNCLVVLSGKVTPAIRNATIKAFGTVKQDVKVRSYTAPKALTNFDRISLHVEDKSQTGIKIGSKLWSRQNPDFNGMFVLNTVLGGYFGSRLMSKIREEKGYTYNIYSGLDMLKYDGYFFISTEVADEYVQATMSDIYSEIRKLKEELIPDDELHMVKNYLRGNFLNMVDGPFKVAGLVKLLEINELQPDFFTNLSQYVKNVTVEDLRSYAQRYLDTDRMLEVVVGG